MAVGGVMGVGVFAFQSSGKSSGTSEHPSPSGPLKYVNFNTAAAETLPRDWFKSWPGTTSETQSRAPYQKHLNLDSWSAGSGRCET